MRNSRSQCQPSRGALVALCCLHGCVKPGEQVDELGLRIEVLRAVNTEVVATEYQAFAARTAELEVAAASFCAGPDAGRLSLVREAWSTSREPWKRMEIVGFGPVVDEPFRFGPLIDFWPVREGVVDDLLGSGTPMDLDSVRTSGASARGLPVVEYLLWHPDLGTPEAFSSDPHRCAYLTALTEDLRLNAEGLYAAWTDYMPSLLAPADQPDFAYRDTQDVVNEWVNRMLFALDDIRSEKLGKPLGDDNQGIPVPEAVESRFSGRSLRDAIDLYTGFELVFDGRDTGFDDLMVPDRTPVAFFDEMTAARTAARSALDGIPEPLESAVVHDPRSVVDAQDALREVQVLVQVEMAQALHVSLSFNDNDGD